MLQHAIGSLLGDLANVQAGAEEWKEKARKICEFAVGFAEQILVSAGFSQEIKQTWRANQLAEQSTDRDFEGCPNDYVTELTLWDVPGKLNSTNRDSMTIERILIFGHGRVLSRRDQDETMSYEDAARFVIFFIKKKILEICMENKWDRVEQLPGLYDKLEVLSKSDEQLQLTGKQLQEKLGLEYNPESLLIRWDSLRQELRQFFPSSRASGTVIYNSVHNARERRGPCEYLADIIAKSDEDIRLFGGMGTQKTIGLDQFLRERYHLKRKMEIAPEVRQWVVKRLGRAF